MAQVDVLARIEAHKEGDRDRLIVRVEEGKFALGRRNAADEFEPTTPIVTLDDILNLADGVLSGDERKVTWPHTVKVLALGYAVARALRYYSPPTTPDRTASAASVAVSPDTADAMPAGGTAPPHDDGPPAGINPSSPSPPTQTGGQATTGAPASNEPFLPLAGAL